MVLITNFERVEKPIYINALKTYKQQTGNNNLYVDNNAYGRNGNRVYELCALRSNSYEELTEFWNIFDKEKIKYEGEL